MMDSKNYLGHTTQFPTTQEEAKSNHNSNKWTFGGIHNQCSICCSPKVLAFPWSHHKFFNKVVSNLGGGGEASLQGSFLTGNPGVVGVWGGKLPGMHSPSRFSLLPLQPRRAPRSPTPLRWGRQLFGAHVVAPRSDWGSNCFSEMQAPLQSVPGRSRKLLLPLKQLPGTTWCDSEVLFLSGGGGREGSITTPQPST